MSDESSNGAMYPARDAKTITEIAALFESDFPELLESEGLSDREQTKQLLVKLRRLRKQVTEYERLAVLYSLRDKIYTQREVAAKQGLPRTHIQKLWRESAPYVPPSE